MIGLRPWLTRPQGDTVHPHPAPLRGTHESQRTGALAPAICDGGPPRREAGALAAFPVALRWTALESPDNGIVHINPDGSDGLEELP